MTQFWVAGSYNCLDGSCGSFMPQAIVEASCEAQAREVAESFVVLSCPAETLAVQQLPLLKAK
jgi:hypothetical protein